MFDTLFLITAVVGGTALAFQFVLMLLGLGEGGDGMDVSGADADISGGIDADAASGGVGDPSWSEAADADLGHPESPWFYEVLSLRTLSAAVTFFGLAGMTTDAFGYSDTISLVVACLAGAAAMYAVYWMFRQVYKLQHAGNENIRNAIGLPATIYVPVPGKGAGRGKVTMRLQNRTVEYQAVTDGDTLLATGEKVVVVAVVGPDTVRVRRVQSPATAQAESRLDVASST